MPFKSAVFALGLSFFAHGVFAFSDQEQVRIIIKYKEGIKNTRLLKSQTAQFIQVPVNQLNPMANGAYLLLLDVHTINLAKSKQKDKTSLILDKLRKNPEILYAVQDRVGYFKPIPDPHKYELSSSLLSHNSQWDEFLPPAGVMLESRPGLRDGAWAYTTGLSEPPVVVAVLDTGISLNESLTDNLVKDSEGTLWGWNFSANNHNLIDEGRSYHGTHVAGTIAAYGQVMTGMGEHLKILPLKIADASGMFYESAVINAIYWAVGAEVPGLPTNIHPAKVLNMSFSIDKGPKDEVDYCDQALQEAVFFARKQGAVLAAAAGNKNVWEHFNAPAACRGTIKVASTGPEGFRSYFSNYGPAITLAAPGGDKRYGNWAGILSTVNPGGGYEGSGFDFYQGTSMATPHVAGVAGLIFAVGNGPLSPEEVEKILYTTTHNFGTTSDANKSCVGEKPCGHGILDAEHAVRAAIIRYDLLFSAPRLDHLAIKNCRSAGLIPSKIRINSAGAVWIQERAACGSLVHYQNPHVERAADGAIIAHYGSSSYRLGQSAYKACDIIGYDGIGCHLYPSYLKVLVFR